MTNSLGRPIQGWTSIMLVCFPPPSQVILLIAEKSLESYKYMAKKMVRWGVGNAERRFVRLRMCKIASTLCAATRRIHGCRSVIRFSAKGRDTARLRMQQIRRRCDKGSHGFSIPVSIWCTSSTGTLSVPLYSLVLPPLL